MHRKYSYRVLNYRELIIRRLGRELRQLTSRTVSEPLPETIADLLKRMKDSEEGRR